VGVILVIISGILDHIRSPWEAVVCITVNINCAIPEGKPVAEVVEEPLEDLLCRLVSPFLLPVSIEGNINLVLDNSCRSGLDRFDPLLVLSLILQAWKLIPRLHIRDEHEHNTVRADSAGIGWKLGLVPQFQVNRQLPESGLALSVCLEKLSCLD
jgi:hypothetical protein